MNNVFTEVLGWGPKKGWAKEKPLQMLICKGF